MTSGLKKMKYHGRAGFGKSFDNSRLELYVDHNFSTEAEVDDRNNTDLEDAVKTRAGIEYNF